MPPIPMPTALPSDWWGLATFALIIAGTVAMGWTKKRADTQQTKADFAGAGTQAAVDALTAAMAAGFTIREKRTAAAEKEARQWETKYMLAVQVINAYRMAAPGLPIVLPGEIAEDVMEE